MQIDTLRGESVFKAVLIVQPEQLLTVESNVVVRRLEDKQRQG